MTALTLSKLFPTSNSFLIFVFYILLFVGQGILVTASQQSDSKYDYNIASAVLLTEVIKLIVSSALYCKDEPAKSFVPTILANRKVLGLYFVPSLLYCIYNNLAFVNLSAFDPTTYYLLLQLRVVVTGILFQVIFNKKLSRNQWISLIILTIGCMTQQLKFDSTSPHYLPVLNFSVFSISGALLLVQIFCSCIAGVYNEYLLKNQGADLNIYIQNVFMYLDSIACNIFVLIYSGTFIEAFQASNLSKVFHYKVLCVMFNNAAIGIVTSFFLKQLNSILKTFASALELVLTAIFSYLFFSIPIYLNTILAIAIVMFAVYLYSKNPVINTITKSTDDRAKEALLDSEEV